MAVHNLIVTLRYVQRTITYCSADRLTLNSELAVYKN